MCVIVLCVPLCRVCHYVVCVTVSVCYRRPTGVPERDVSAHLVPVKLKEKQKLEELLREADADNHRLQTVIRGRRKRLLRMHESIRDDTLQLVEVSPVFVRSLTL